MLSWLRAFWAGIQWRPCASGKSYTPPRATCQRGAYIEAMSAIDIALWDLMGQELGQPVHRLLGGAFRDSIHAYATGCYYRGEDYLDTDASLPVLADEARSYVAAGFDMLKIKVGLLPVAADLERVWAIRQAIGSGAGLMVDANHAYNAFTAVRMGRGLEEVNALWFEEPVPPEDHAGTGQSGRPWISPSPEGSAHTPAMASCRSFETAALTSLSPT